MKSVLYEQKVRCNYLAEFLISRFRLSCIVLSACASSCFVCHIIFTPNLIRLTVEFLLPVSNDWFGVQFDWTPHWV
jgi:hypothetical protein